MTLGVVLTIAGTVTTAALHRQTEQRLLDQQTAEAGAVLVTAISGVQSPLAAAAELAEATDGDPDAFVAVMARSIELAQFRAAALFAVTSTTPVVTAGEAIVLGDAGAGRIQRMLDQAIGVDELAVIDLLDLPGRRLGYAYTSPNAAADARFVVYAESMLPASRTDAPRPTGAFSELDYALYLGDAETDEALLYASTADLPIEGRRGSTVVPFGDRQLLLVTSSTTTLAGALSPLLPWLVAAVGAGFTVIAAAVTELLVRRQRRAVALSADLARLYDDQRARTDTLRRSLIPASVPTPPGTEIVARYRPAAAADEVGGDFYDLFRVDESRWALVIGDVCGRGIDAAALTAVTRHTIRAAARHLDTPTEVLRWTHDAVAEFDGGTYSTACFGFLTIEDPAAPMLLEMSLGGHPPPLLCRHDGSVREIGEHGTVLGIVEPRVRSWSTTIRPGDLLVLYTDGITDAPGGAALTVTELEQIVATNRHAPLATVADEIERALADRRPAGYGDDVALLLLRHTPVAPAADAAAPSDALSAG